MEKPFDPPVLSQLDAGIQDLVVTLNRHPLFCTVGSCRGHDEGNWATTNVQFLVGGLDGVFAISRVLNDAQAECEEASFECRLVYSLNTLGCTDLYGDDPWVGFQLDILEWSDDYDGQGPFHEMYSNARVPDEVLATVVETLRKAIDVELREHPIPA